jgi:hypothetical protein
MSQSRGTFSIEITNGVSEFPTVRLQPLCIISVENRFGLQDDNARPYIFSRLVDGQVNQQLGGREVGNGVRMKPMGAGIPFGNLEVRNTVAIRAALHFFPSQTALIDAGR